jgi:hypothetical protein
VDACGGGKSDGKLKGNGGISLDVRLRIEVIEPEQPRTFA